MCVFLYRKNWYYFVSKKDTDGRKTEPKTSPLLRDRDTNNPPTRSIHFHAAGARLRHSVGGQRLLPRRTLGYSGSIAAESLTSTCCCGGACSRLANKKNRKHSGCGRSLARFLVWTVSGHVISIFQQQPPRSPTHLQELVVDEKRPPLHRAQLSLLLKRVAEFHRDLRAENRAIAICGA